MTGRIDRTLCPKCGAMPPTLWIDTRMVAKPTGAYSIAGTGTKVVATFKHFLRCRNCTLDLPGTMTGDGYVDFVPEAF